MLSLFGTEYGGLKCYMEGYCYEDLLCWVLLEQEKEHRLRKLQRNMIFLIFLQVIFSEPILKRNRAWTESKTYMDQGLLVPDELVVDLVVDRVNQEDCSKGYVLDGFPRTIPQAEALDKALSAMGQKMDYAINVEVPDENIVNRMSGRRACVDCGATYHIVYAPTEKEDVCDKCGGSLILRDDDKPETVLKRLGVYHEQTQPLIDYYTKAGNP